MQIRINNLNMSYQNKSVESVQVNYLIENDESTIRGNGSIELQVEDYDGSIEALQAVCKEHLLQNIGDVDYEIRSTNMIYDKNEVKNVDVIFSCTSENRELNITGNYSISSEKYDENNTPLQLEVLAKKYIKEILGI